jgi:hypothetical protein
VPSFFNFNSSKLSAIILMTWFGLLVATASIFHAYQVYRPDFSYTSVNHFNQALPLWAQHWLTPWANFDGVHYLQIAAEGYVDQGRFLPLFPGVLASISWLTGGAEVFSTKQLLVSWFVSLALFGAALTVWSKLLRLDYQPNQAQWALLLALAFPTSFFLISIYTESLFLLLAGLSLLLARQKRWWWALLPTALLTITRLTGFVVIPTLLYLKWREDKPSSLLAFIKQNWQWGVGLGLTTLPLIGYAYFNFMKWGDWLYFVQAHGALGNSRETTSIVLPPVTLVRYAKILLTLSPQLHEFKVAVVELGMFIGMAALTIAAWFKKVPQEYMLFGGLAMAIPMLSGTLTGFPRYSLAALPLVLTLVDLPNPVKISLVAVSFLLQFLLLSWFTTGYFVA